MNQRVINLSVQGSVIKYAGEAVGASGSHNSIVLRVEFDDQWADTTKSAYFTDALGEKTVEIVLALDSLVLGQENVYDVPVPFEAMKYPGHAIISFKGTVTSEETVSKAITTAFGKFRVYDSAIPESADNAGEITPDTATQLQAEIDALKDLFSTAVEVSNEAKQAAQNAAASAYSAQTSKTAAETAQAAAETAETGAEESATLSKSWAVGGTGTRPGEDTNNAEYWAGQAAAAAGGGVISFNGRTGTVLPQDGDYDADKVGAANKELNNLDAPQLALVNLGGSPSKDIFDNSDFRNPVNQRGVKDTVVQSGGFILDRWTVVYDSGAAPKYDSAGFLSLDNTGGSGNLFLTQKIPQEDFSEETACTISLFCKSGFYFSPIAVCGDRVYMHDSKINAILTVSDGVVSATIGIATGQKEEIVATKLNVGKLQTQAYQRDGQWHLFETKKYADVLTRCQRYLIVETAENEKRGTVYSNTSGVFTISTAVQMRTTPVLLELKGYEPKIALSDGSTVLITKEEITVLGADVSGVRVRVDVTGGKTLKLGTASIRDCNMVLSAEL